MASVKHFLSKQREKTLAWKRGGRADVVSLDADEVEGRYRYEPVDKLTPEEIFERRWALTVLERALGRLRREQEDADHGREFEHLEGFLTGHGAMASYREVAERLRTSESAVKSSIHRLRQRFGQVLRSEIAETVSSPTEVDNEVKHLLGVIAPWGRPPS